MFLPPFLMVVLFAPWIVRYRKHPAVQGFTVSEPLLVGASALAGLALFNLR